MVTVINFGNLVIGVKILFASNTVNSSVICVVGCWARLELF